MDWQAFGAGAAVIGLVLTCMATIIKLVVSNELGKFRIIMEERFVTKEIFDNHITNCPAMK